MSIAPNPASKSSKKGPLLFFSPSLRSGGMERRLVELLSYLKVNSDYELHLVLTEEEIHYKYVEQLGIPITVLKRSRLRKDPGVFYRFWREVSRLRPSLIHSWDRMTTFYAIPAARLLKVPLVNSQITDARERNASWSFDNFVWKINRRFASQIIANSYAGLRAYGVSTENGLVIHNGVRLDRFRMSEAKDEVKRKYGIEAPYVFAMVASFSEKKDQARFIELARRVESTRSDVAFVAIGDGPTRKKLMHEVSDRGPGNFYFTGQIKEVEALVAASDVGVLLTQSEGISNAILEYMALKKPVIATDAGGTNELVVHGETGFLVEPGNNIDEVFSRTMELLASAELRREMGERASARICAAFSVERMGSDFLRLYDDLSCCNAN